MALPAGRVGVAPDQVDIFGKIKLDAVAEKVISVMAEKVPFLTHKWCSIRYVCDGNGHYDIISPDIEGITLEHISGSTNVRALLLPVGLEVIGYFWGFASKTVSEGFVFNNGGYYLNTLTGACGFYLNDVTVEQDITLWVAVKPVSNNNLQLTRTLGNTGSKKSTKNNEE